MNTVSTAWLEKGFSEKQLKLRAEGLSKAFALQKDAISHAQVLHALSGLEGFTSYGALRVKLARECPGFCPHCGKAGTLELRGIVACSNIGQGLTYGEEGEGKQYHCLNCTGSFTDWVGDWPAVSSVNLSNTASELAPERQFLIYSETEGLSSEDVPGFWSNSFGWTGIGGATVFSKEERDAYQTLPGVDGNSRWVSKSEAMKILTTKSESYDIYSYKTESAYRHSDGSPEGTYADMDEAISVAESVANRKGVHCVAIIDNRNGQEVSY